MPIDLSIIVVSWNTRDLLAQCLDSIFAHPPCGDCEVWVVDNASTDGSAAMVRTRFPGVRLFENRENMGFARANNQAIRASAGEYVLLLNSDTIVQPGAITLMLRQMDIHPDIGIVGAKLLNPDGSFQASYNDFPSLLSVMLSTAGLASYVYGRYHPSYPPEQSLMGRPADWVGGACLMARRQAIDQVGLLDADFFMYSEEMDWCYRFWENGWKVYFLPEAEVIHYGGQSSSLMPEKRLVRLSKTKIRFLSKYRGRLLATSLEVMMRIMAAAKALFWLCIFLASRQKRDLGWLKVRANWRLVTLNEL